MSEQGGRPDGDRDRDDRGRAESGRPRDATGRPLPRGSATDYRATLRAKDELQALPPDEAVVEAERLVLDGAPFYAHEVIEGPWHLAAPDQRLFWQGLAQVAVGLTHVQRGNAVGAQALLRSGADKLVGYPDGHHGVAVARVVDDARRLADRVETDGVASLTAADLRLPFRTAG